jgi:hypothetical protein
VPIFIDRGAPDVQHMIEVGRRGIKYALDHADCVESDDPATAAKLMEIAKTISFNVGANSWPGWGDDGVEISSEQRKAGIEAADRRRRPNSLRRTRKTMTRSRSRFPSPRFPSPRFPSPARAHPVPRA